MGVFRVFFICTNGTKSRKALHIFNFHGIKISPSSSCSESFELLKIQR